MTPAHPLMNIETPEVENAAFGLSAWLVDRTVNLPLTHVETRFRVTGDVACVEIDQVFEQTESDALDVLYTFPLPAAAAVHRCEMIINGRVIRAVVMEERKAWEFVAEQKAAGHRTALVGVNRENLFTLQLGNASPGDRIVIRFAYVESLERLSNQLSLRIPFTPGVRYIPGRPLLRESSGHGMVGDTDEVPDASRITPPRMSSENAGAATLSLEGTLDAEEVDLRTLGSPTHATVTRKENSLLTVRLAGDQAVPDRDFSLRWEEAATTEPVLRSWACRHAGGLHALLQIRAPQHTPSAAEAAFEQDVYFLLDRSGSMAGANWTKSAEALHAFVRLLGPRDRVWLTCFESEFQDFNTEPLARDAVLADEHFRKLAHWGVLGGTELLPALVHVLEMHARHSASAGRPARIVLITDGQVGNEQAILDLVAEPDAVGLPVYCFGIDRAVNDFFLQSLARNTGGRAALFTPGDDIPAAISRLAQVLRQPVLVGLEIQGGHLTANGGANLPDLHAGEVSVVAVRCEPGAETAGVTVTCHLPDGTPWSRHFELSPQDDDQAPRLVWARQRTQHLCGVGWQEQAVPLAIEHNILCPGTSFVAWDEMEKVQVAKKLLYQPCLGGDSGIEFEAAPESICPEAQIEEGRDDLRELLIEEGFSYPKAVQITVLMELWTYCGHHENGYELLDELIENMQDAVEPLELLRDFIDQYITDDNTLEALRKCLVEKDMPAEDEDAEDAKAQEALAHAALLCATPLPALD